MKFSIKRDALLNPLQTVVGVIARQQAMPILSNILLSIKNQELTITATDTEIELISATTTETPADKNATTISGRKLFDICRVLPQDCLIQFEQKDESRISLTTEHDHFVLATLPATNFPNIPWDKEQKGTEFAIEQTELLALLECTHFAMAKQDVRYYLNGLTLELKEDTLAAIASDGHRLASNVVNISNNNGGGNASRVIMPYKGVLELMRLLTNSTGTLSVAVGSNHLRVVTDAFTFTTKLVDSTAPNYERAIPKNGDKKVTMNREMLRQALQRVAILAHEVSREVQLQFSTGMLNLKTQTHIQQAEEQFPIDYNGEKISINFNINYVLDIFNHANADEITIVFKDGISSVLFEEATKESNSLYVVMPLRA